MALLIASFLIMVWIAGKVYRTGILMYGKKPSLSEVIKWMKYN
jgi:ABC-2 type transport system permease protein